MNVLILSFRHQLWDEVDRFAWGLHLEMLPWAFLKGRH